MTNGEGKAIPDGLVVPMGKQKRRNHWGRKFHNNDFLWKHKRSRRRRKRIAIQVIFIRKSRREYHRRVWHEDAERHRALASSRNGCLNGPVRRSHNRVEAGAPSIPHPLAPLACVIVQCRIPFAPAARVPKLCTPETEGGEPPCTHGQIVNLWPGRASLVAPSSCMRVKFLIVPPRKMSCQPPKL